MLHGGTAESTGANLFLSVIEENRLVHDSKNLVSTSGRALKSNSGLTCKGGLLVSSNVLGDRDGHEVNFAGLVGDSLHVHGLDKLELGHESFKGLSPTFREGLKELA